MKAHQIKVAIVGAGKWDVARLLAQHGLKSSSRHPDIVISYGGDGTALEAERQYPGVPRLLIRNSLICRQCSHHTIQEIEMALEMLAKGQYTVKEEMKIEASVRGRKKKMVALNEFNIHYIPPTALRMNVSVNGKRLLATRHRHDERTHLLHDVFIGDGLVVSTPHGSKGYFKSITHRAFGKGIGIAFNNTVQSAKPSIARPQDTVQVTIVRGPGALYADNIRKFIALRDDDTIMICRDKAVARTILLKR